MSARRKSLGRGLGALIPGPAAGDSAAPAAASADAAPEPAAGPARELPIDRIHPNPEQPRRLFDADHLQELADSIRRHGVLQPVVVRTRADGDWELVVGERRWRASRAAGRETIPAVVADVEPADRLEIAIVENVQRRDLNPMELAYAYQALAEGGATQEEIGRRVGLDRSSVANHLRLLELPRDLQADVEAGRISMGHAKALLQVSSPERQRHLRDEIVRSGLSVRAAEEAARRLASPGGVRAARKKPAPPAASDPSLEPLAEALRRHLQTQVRIEGTAKRGQIRIDYFDAEDLERIVSAVVDAGVR